MSFENPSPIVQQPSSSDLSFIAGAGGVAAGQLVYVSADGTILPTTGAQAYVGVVKVGAAAGKIATVIKGPAKVRVTVSSVGAIAAGDLVVSAANGKAQTNNSPTTKYAVCDTGASSGGTAIVIL